MKIKQFPPEVISSYPAASIKEDFLRSALQVAKAVGKQLARHGFTSKAHINRGGIAVSGEVYAYYTKNSTIVLVEYGTCLGPICIRAVVRQDGRESPNFWINPLLDHTEIAAEVCRLLRMVCG